MNSFVSPGRLAPIAVESESPLRHAHTLGIEVDGGLDVSAPQTCVGRMPKGVIAAQAHVKRLFVQCCCGCCIVPDGGVGTEARN